MDSNNSDDLEQDYFDGMPDDDSGEMDFVQGEPKKNLDKVNKNI